MTDHWFQFCCIPSWVDITQLPEGDGDPKAPPMPFMDWLRKVDHRVRRALTRMGINSWKQLLLTSADELLETKNFGYGSMRNMVNMFSRHGGTPRSDWAMALHERIW